MMRNMEEGRTVTVSVILAASVAARLDAYARDHRWSRSGAAAALIERGLSQQKEEGTS